MKAIFDEQTLALGFVGPRRDGLMGDKQVMQAGGAGKTHLQSGIEHRGGLVEQGLGMVEGDRLHEALGREPTRPAGEEALEMVRRQADMA